MHFFHLLTLIFVSIPFVANAKDGKYKTSFFNALIHLLYHSF